MDIMVLYNLNENLFLSIFKPGLQVGVSGFGFSPTPWPPLRGRGERPPPPDLLPQERGVMMPPVSFVIHPRSRYHEFYCTLDLQPFIG